MTAAVIRFVVSPSTRSSSDEDGTTILEVTQNKIYSVVGVGSIIWQQLVRSKTALAQYEIVHNLEDQFASISSSQIEADVASILSSFQQRKLIQVEDLTRHDRHPATSAKTMALAFVVISIQLCLKLRFRILPTIFLLLLVDLLLKLGSLDSLYRLVSNWPISNRLRTSETVDEIWDSVTRAFVIYPKHAMCLQRSAVATCVLRSFGITAQMVIGCQRRPFLVHAWAEANGKVVNDRQSVTETHYVMDRI